MGTTLRAVGWDHARCRGPMLAAAERWRALGGAEIVWSFRPLAAFNDEPVERLAAAHDLVVIDHPFVGRAAVTGCLRPLDALLAPAELAALAEDAVGASHASYAYAGHQWALAADAACQVAAARDDLLARAEATAPATWDEVERLAAELPGRVALPLYPTDAICSLLSLLAGLGAPAGHGEVLFADRDAGERALRLLVSLVPHLHPDSLELNPPRALDRMCDTEEIAYAPLLFGYATYARPGGRAGPDEIRPLRFLPPPSFAGAQTGSLLGGAGLAVSSACQAPDAAAAFAAWVCSREAQRDVVFPAGGQPASRTTWLDPELDAAASGFFSATLATIERAHVRPREPWWPPFQEEAGEIVHGFLARGGTPAGAASALEEAFARHRRTAVAAGVPGKADPL
jgi:multiple sugar transport system substrate-binding protein